MSDVKIERGSKVLVRTDQEAWGVRVLDPEWAEECRLRDIESGNSMDDAGEPRLYSHVRVYNHVWDGEGLITVTEVRGKASYLRIRGVYHAPKALVRGETPNGRSCWFRSTDVVAVG